MLLVLFTYYPPSLLSTFRYLLRSWGEKAITHTKYRVCAMGYKVGYKVRAELMRFLGGPPSRVPTLLSQPPVRESISNYSNTLFFKYLHIYSTCIKHGVGGTMQATTPPPLHTPCPHFTNPSIKTTCTHHLQTHTPCPP